jgi:hypothetical protein
VGWLRLRARRGAQPRRTVGRYYPQREELIGVLRDFIDELFGGAVHRSGKRTWCEKTPLNLLSIPFLWELFPEARVVVMVRHPRQVVGSYQDQPWAPSSLEDVLGWLEPIYRRWLAQRPGLLNDARYVEVRGASATRAASSRTQTTSRRVAHVCLSPGSGSCCTTPGNTRTRSSANCERRAHDRPGGGRQPQRKRTLSGLYPSVAPERDANRLRALSVRPDDNSTIELQRVANGGAGPGGRTFGHWQRGLHRLPDSSSGGRRDRSHLEPLPACRDDTSTPVSVTPPTWLGARHRRTSAPTGAA